MKILMSALACEPGKGSELEVGFRAMLAAATKHEVWVLTNSHAIPAIRRAIESHPHAERIHLEGIAFEVDEELYARLTAPGFHWYYDRWQRRAALRAVELDRRIDFDLVHHVTLAAHWTRVGVTAVEKPLVWGPVGGGVETPPALFGELGWRGIAEDVGRIVARRVLARVGPARVVQRRAVVAFAQNRETARFLSVTGRLEVLPNATCVEVGNVATSGVRCKDVVMVGRLLPWKGGRLAVRALRYVEDQDAILRIFGGGLDRGRIARAARRFGVEDRIRFESQVPREDLMRIVATAGVFLHPAFHDESPLAVAEALSLGAPLVCLDWGGPPELLRHWPGARAVAVPASSPEATARALAAAIDQFLLDPPPVSTVAGPSATSFADELLAAYDVALILGKERAREWRAFPAGKPQVFAKTSKALSQGVLVYGFGRRLPKLAQMSLAVQVRVPLVRRLITESGPRPEPVCGSSVWHSILAEVQRRNAGTPFEWILFRSQWDKQRSSALGLGEDGAPKLFVVVEPERGKVPPVIGAAYSFQVPRCTDTFSLCQWSVRQYAPLPRFHHSATWDASRIREVADEVSSVLQAVLERPPGTPRHWRPIHGDFVPWNLREDQDGRFWLLDWEDVGWGPPLADFARYAVAHHSLRRTSPEAAARSVRRALGHYASSGLEEVCAFWVDHPNLQRAAHHQYLSRAKARDVLRANRELAILRALQDRT